MKGTLRKEKTIFECDSAQRKVSLLNATTKFGRRFFFCALSLVIISFDFGLCASCASESFVLFACFFHSFVYFTSLEHFKSAKIKITSNATHWEWGMTKKKKKQHKKIHPTINNNNPCAKRAEKKNIFNDNDNVQYKMMHFVLSNCNVFGLWFWWFMQKSR